MESELLRLQQEAQLALDGIKDTGGLESFRIQYLGRKGGALTGVMRQLKAVAAEDRPRLGQLANDIKQAIELRFEEIRAQLGGDVNRGKSGAIDCSLPGRMLPYGTLHPVTQVMEEICSIFEGLGFAVAEGPDVETDYYNFEALNIPPHHPARDILRS